MKGKKGSRKISKVKKSNIKRNKLVRAGKLKPKSKPGFVEGGQFQGKKNKEKLSQDDLERRKEYEEEKKKRETEMYMELQDMMDPEDLAYLKKNAKNAKALNIDIENKKKRKFEDMNENGNNSDSSEDEGFDEYEKSAVKRIKEERDNDSSVKKRDLLPVRSDKGWEKRSVEVQDNDDIESDENCEANGEDEEESNE